MRKIAQMAMVACSIFAPSHGFGQSANKPAAKPASANYTVVGYNRSIRQQDFAGLSKATVLRLQHQLEVIYRNLPDWQHDFALRARPLDDGIVGPVTLSWLQRYGFNFKITPGEAGKAFPAHMERMAVFAAAHPAELDILLGKSFEAWDEANPAATRAQDYAIRRQGDAAALMALVARYRASLVSAPVRPATLEVDGYHSYVLTAEDLEVLGGKVLIAEVLGKFKDKPYASKEALKAAIAHVLKGRAYVLDKVWPAIDRSLHAFDGYLFDATSRNKLKKEGMDEATIDELAALGTVYLKARADFDAFVEAKANSGELAVTEEEIAQLADATKVFDNFHLDQQALDTIDKQLSGNVQFVGLPGYVLKMLEQIKEVDYPDSAIFHSAARSKFAFGLGMCKQNAELNNSYVAALAMPDEQLALLRKEMEGLRPSAADGATPPSLDHQFEAIKVLRRSPHLCSDDDKKKATAIVKSLYDTYLLAAVESAGRKKMPDKIEGINIQGGDCGCALDDMAGAVYGFYPYWWVQKGTQPVNFRVLNRMAYYGLTVDNTGEFRLGKTPFDIADGRAESNAFVRIARQHNSKVDWLIQKNDWGREWHALTPEGKRAVFKRILANISTLLNAPLTNIGARVKQVTSLGVAPPPRRGDGVTLFFPNYPLEADATDQFNVFYLELRAEMDKHGLWLNLLVTQDMLETGKNGGGGAFGMYNLIKLRKARGVSEQRTRPGLHDNDEYLLVLLNEPSADAKKILRMDIENDSMVHGADRADFLRSILPIIHFDDRNWQQLDDDIVYSRDNFGGVGFWAPDFDNLAQAVKTGNLSCLDSKQFAVCLLKNYRDESVADSLPGPIEVFACVHRWLLHWIMLFLVATGIVLIVLFFTFCKVRNVIKNHFLWAQLLIVLPALLIFILLLLYDPYLVSLSEGNLPFFVAAAIIMVGVGVGYRFWRAQRHVPQRQRGLPQREGTGFPILVWKIESDQGGFRWLIKNRGSGYAIIKKVEILLDGNPVADAKTALASVMESGNNVLWKSVPLVGQKLEAGKQLVGLSIPNGDAARAFEHKLKAHDLAVQITYSGPNNEHWTSDGSGITSISGVA